MLLSWSLSAKRVRWKRWEQAITRINHARYNGGRSQPDMKPVHSQITARTLLKALKKVRETKASSNIQQCWLSSRFIQQKPKTVLTLSIHLRRGCPPMQHGKNDQMDLV